MRNAIKALIIVLPGLAIPPAPAHAAWCGNPQGLPVGSVGQLSSTGGPFSFMIVDRLPVGTTGITISQQPGLKNFVVYSGAIAAGQRVNLGIQNFWYLFNGSGGNAIVRMCHP